MPLFKVLSAKAWLHRLQHSAFALPLLFVLSMAETLLIPIPIETVLIPWMLSQQRRRWTIAAVALAGNIFAAALGYWLGALATAQWGDALISLFGSVDAYQGFAEKIRINGFSAILAVGVTPTPLQIAMLVAGATGYSFGLFLVAITLSRAFRYFGLAVLVHFAGDAALAIWQRYSGPVGAVLLVLAAFWLGYVFL